MPKDRAEYSLAGEIEQASRYAGSFARAALPPGVDPATLKSLATQALAIANWNGRLWTTYFMALEDPGLGKGDFRPVVTAKRLLSAEGRKILSAGYDNETARNIRLHDLRTVDAVGRAIYTGWKLGNRAFKYPTAPGAAVQVMGDLYVRNPEVLARYRETFESPGASEFVATWGPWLVDLPGGLLFDLVSVPFALIARGRKAIGFLKRLEVAREWAKKGISAQDVFLQGLFRFETSAPIPMDRARFLAELAKEGRVFDIARYLQVWSHRVPSKVAQILPSWFRPAGSPASNIGWAFYKENQDAWRVWMKHRDNALAAVYNSSKTAAKMTADEWALYNDLVQRYEGVQSLDDYLPVIADDILKKNTPPYSENVLELYREAREVFKGDLHARQALRPKTIELRRKKADKLLEPYQLTWKDLEIRLDQLGRELQGLPQVSGSTLATSTARRTPGFQRALSAHAKHLPGSSSDIIRQDPRFVKAQEVAAEILDHYAWKLKVDISTEAGFNKVWKHLHDDTKATLKSFWDMKLPESRLAKDPRFRDARERLQRFNMVLRPENAAFNFQKNPADGLAFLEGKIESAFDRAPAAGAGYNKGLYPKGGEGHRALIPKDVEMEVLRLLDDDLPEIEHYFMSFKRELDEGRRTAGGFAEGLHRYERWKENPRIVPITPREYIEALEKVARRIATESAEVSLFNYSNRLGKVIAHLDNLPAERIGGEGVKALHLRELRAFKEEADTILGNLKKPPAGEAVPRQQALAAAGLFLDAWDGAMASLKVTYLIGRPGFHVLNAIDEAFKRVAHFGLSAVFGGPTADLAGRTFDLAGRFKGFEGARSLYDMVPGLSKFKDLTLSKPAQAIQEHSMRIVYGRSYWDKVAELRKADPAADPAHVDKAAHVLAAGEIDRINFNVFNPAPVVRNIGRVIPFYDTFIHRILALWTRYAAEHPVGAASFLRLENALRESSIAGDGKVRLPGTDVYADLLSPFSPMDIIRAARNTRPIQPGETALQTAVNTARALDNFADNVLKDPTHLGLAMDMLKGDASRFVEEAPDPATKAQRREKVRQMSQVVKPMNDIITLTTGRGLDQWAAYHDFLGRDLKEQEEARVSRGVRELSLAQEIDGLPIKSEEELEAQLFAEQRWRQALYWNFGLRAERDVHGALRKLRTIKAQARAIPDEATRQAFVNSFRPAPDKPISPENQPYLKGILEPIPFSHPDADELYRFNLIKDNPEKVRDFYQKASDSAKTGILDNFYQKLKSGYEKFRQEFFDQPEAGAAEIELPKGYLKNQKKQKADIVALYHSGEQAHLLDIPEPSIRGGYAFIRKDLMDSKDESEAKAWREMNRTLQRQFNAVMLRAEVPQTLADLNSLRSRELPILAEGGKTVNLDTSWLFEDVKGLEGQGGRFGLAIQKQLVERQTLAAKTGKTGPDPQETKLSALWAWARNPDTAPFWVAKFEDIKVKADNAALDKWVKALRDSARDPVSIPPDMVLGEIGAGAPKDFWKRAAKAGYWKELQDFALAERSQDLSYISSVLTGFDHRGRRGVAPGAVDYLAAGGYLPELLILAQKDRGIKDALQELGYPTDPRDTASFATANLLRSGGVEITDELMAASGGYLRPGLIIPTSRLDFKKPAFRTEYVTRAEPADPVFPASPSFDPELIGLSPQREYHSTSDYMRSVADATHSINAVILAGNRAALAAGRPSQVRSPVSVFHVAARHISALPPTEMARGAGGIMSLGYRLGFVDRDSLNAVSTGLAQADIIGEGANAAISILSWTSNSFAGMAVAQRVATLRTAAMTAEKAGETATAASLRSTANLTAGLSAAGAALSISSGVLKSQGEEEASIATGVAGGALTGASIGMYFGPWGAAAGAAIGGAIGGLTAAFGGGGDRMSEEQRMEMENMRKAREFEMREQAVRRSAAGVMETQRLLERAEKRGLPAIPPKQQQLAQFFRRPTFQSYVGLVSEVERNAARQFRPRF